MQNRQPRFAYPATAPKLRVMFPTRFPWMQSRNGVRWAVVALGCLSTIAMANSEPGMETLFYTPLERQNIERARLSPVETGAEAEASLAKLSGVVRRVAGKGTVWINGTPIPEGTPKAGKIRGMDAVVDGHRLRVGESIDKSTGERSDVVAPGAVTVQKQP